MLTPTSESRLSWFYYLFAPLTMLLAIALFVVLLFGGLKSVDRSLTRVIVPGKTTVQLAKPGSYTIFYEYRSEVGGRTFDTGDEYDFSCDFQPGHSGEQVVLAMGTGVTAQIFKMVLTGLAVLLLGFCAMGLIFAAVYRERNPRRRKIYAPPPGTWPSS